LIGDGLIKYRPQRFVYYVVVARHWKMKNYARCAGLKYIGFQRIETWSKLTKNNVILLSNSAIGYLSQTSDDFLRVLLRPRCLSFCPQQKQWVAPSRK
jgi:hypothetical protein